MSNLIAALAWCNRGDEMIMGQEAHMFWNESAGPTALSGAQIRLVPNDASGRIAPEDVAAAVRDSANIHVPATALVCLENTHNRCSGGVMTPQDTKAVVEVAHAAGAAVHLDGARIFNAAVALEVPAAALTQDVDDVSFCLSKALSCPVGSVLCGSAEFITRARKWRKMLGGGMRQAGVLAAAGMVALDTMVERLADDHANARRLAAGLANIDGITVDPDGVQTNIVIFEVDQDKVGEARSVIAALREDGVLVSHSREQSLRMVTHRQVDSTDVDEALARVNGTVRRLVAAV